MESIWALVCEGLAVAYPNGFVAVHDVGMGVDAGAVVELAATEVEVAGLRADPGAEVMVRVG